MTKKSPAADVLAALEKRCHKAKYAFYEKASPEFKAILDDIKRRQLSGEINYSAYALFMTLREMHGLACDRMMFATWLRDTDDGQS